MPINTYIGMRLAPNGHGTLACMLNSLVHVVMYTYYGLACCGDRVKPFLWWKKYITQMQLIQFGIIFIHMANAFFRPSCDYPPHTFYVMSAILVSFTILFVNFYIQQYIKPFLKNTIQPTIIDKFKEKNNGIPDTVLKQVDYNGNHIINRSRKT